MFTHDQILINPKSYGHVYDVCQENMCLLYGVCRCIDLKVLLTAVSAFFPKIFNQPFTLKPDFVLEGWNILCSSLSLLLLLF